MKIIFGSRRHHYLARASIFLIMVALIAGMVGCGGGGGDGDGGSYTLTVDLTAGGIVTVNSAQNNVPIAGKAMFIYDPGTVVSLNATPDVGYQFVEWTGNVSTVANVTAAIINITMNGNYLITANFGLEVYDWYDLNATRDSLDGHHILMNDLNSTTAGYTELASPTANGGKGWQPIGTFNTTFTGIFDGQGYEIRDLFIDRPDGYYVGLFGVVYEGGVIQDISVVNITVTGYDRVGGLVGGNAGTINTCYSTGSVTGNNFTGGLVGGSRNGTISESYAIGNVTGSNWIGGLVGSMNETTVVSNSYSTGSMTGDYYVGGLVGVSVNCTVSNCYATGTETGSIDVGGLMGLNVGSVSNSYSTGSVTGTSGSFAVGGLVGWNAWGTIDNCYSTGSVSGNASIGGLVGENTGTVSNSFWDIQTSGQNISAGGTGKNTTEMQDIITFSGATWNITTVGGIGERNTTYIWNIVNTMTYPFLSWQP